MVSNLIFQTFSEPGMVIPLLWLFRWNPTDRQTEINYKPTPTIKYASWLENLPCHHIIWNSFIYLSAFAFQVEVSTSGLVVTCIRKYRRSFQSQHLWTSCLHLWAIFNKIIDNSEIQDPMKFIQTGPVVENNDNTMGFNPAYIDRRTHVKYVGMFRGRWGCLTLIAPIIFFTATSIKARNSFARRSPTDQSSSTLSIRVFRSNCDWSSNSKQSAAQAWPPRAEMNVLRQVRESRESNGHDP